jgi:hypothetical protein
MTAENEDLQRPRTRAKKDWGIELNLKEVMV